MKILQVITRTDAGGAQMVVALLANELVHKGHDVTVVAGCGDGTIWKWVDKKVKRVECLSLCREISFFNDIKTIANLKKIHEAINPDIIHLHSSKAGFLGRLVFPRKKTVFTVHGFDRIGLGRKLLEYAMQYRCSAIVGVCKNDLRNLLSAGISRNVTYVFNGIEKPTGVKPDLWHIPQTYKKVILCIARLEPQKNHKLYYEVARLLPEYAFVWIGNTMPVNNHPQNVFFLGTLPSASLYCQLCDVFCLPSNYEGLPMTIIEAMSYEKPVVSSNVGGISEIVRNDINGYVLDNEALLFSSKIQYIIETPGVYEKMSRNARTIFETELTVENMTNSYVNIYEKIVANK